MLGHVCRCGCVSSGAGCGNRGFGFGGTCRGVCGQSRFLRVPHRNFPLCPESGYRYGLPWPDVRAFRLKKWKDVFRTSRRPGRQQSVAGLIQRASAMNSDESVISHVIAPV